jgi:hypothetical protein
MQECQNRRKRPDNPRRNGTATQADSQPQAMLPVMRRPGRLLSWQPPQVAGWITRVSRGASPTLRRRGRPQDGTRPGTKNAVFIAAACALPWLSCCCLQKRGVQAPHGFNTRPGNAFLAQQGLG